MYSGKIFSLLFVASIMLIAVQHSHAQYPYGYYYPSYYYVVGKRGAGFYEHPQTLPATDRQGNNIRVQPRPYDFGIYQETSYNNRAFPDRP